MDVKLLAIFLLVCLACVTDQRRLRHDRGRHGLRRYGSVRHHKWLGRHQGQGRRLAAAKKRKLMRMLPYEAEEDVKVRERMNVSLWKLGVRSEGRDHLRPKRDISDVSSAPTPILIPNPNRKMLSGDSEYKLQKERLVQTRQTTWPIPRHLVTKTHQVYRLDPRVFHFTIRKSLRSCTILTDALRRYYTYITGVQATDWSVQDRNDGYPVKGDPSTLDHVDIELESCTDGYPATGADEAYDLHVTEGAASISSRQVWGTLRGLETLAQLAETHPPTGELYIPATEITDYPGYPHRGISINTSMHYLATDTIQGILRRMEQNKLNTLHWVLSFDQAYNLKQDSSGSDHAYSSRDVNDIVEYARARGILVIPEVNTLSNVASDMQTADCIHGKKTRILDISNKLTYPFIRTALGNILAAFPQSSLLLGSSLPDTRCWKQSPKIKRFMSEMGITDYHHLVAFHTQRLVEMIRQLDASRTILVYHRNSSTLTCNSSLVRFGKLEPTSTERGKEFSLHYWCQRSASPGLINQDIVFGSPTLDSSNVVGGELTIWPEDVDSHSALPASWLSMTTVAGRLWSALEETMSTDHGVRVHEQLCRMMRREFSVNIPDTCRL